MSASTLSSIRWGLLSFFQLTFFLHLCGMCLATNYYVGTGIADITGPAAQVNMVSRSIYKLIYDYIITWISKCFFRDFELIFCQV